MNRRSLKRLWNRPEGIVYDRLVQTCAPYDAKVFPKVRVADILNIDGSGINKAWFSYALKSHFDFVVVAASGIPLFAVEFDGPMHDDSVQKERDSIKDRLCQDFGLPLLRIRDAHLEVHRTYDVLTWIVEQWFFREAFDEAQERGEIPFDEAFDPFAITSIGDEDGKRFPFWLAAEARGGLLRLSKQGRLESPIPHYVVGIDQRGNYRGLFWVDMTDAKVVWVTTGARAQNFRVFLPPLVAELGILELHKELRRVLAGTAPPRPRADLDVVLRHYEGLQHACSCRSHPLTGK